MGGGNRWWWCVGGFGRGRKVGAEGDSVRGRMSVQGQNGIVGRKTDNAALLWRLYVVL